MNEILNRLILQVGKLEAYIQEVETKLLAANNARSRLLEVDIPALLEEMGLKSAITDSGCKVELKEVIRARITEENAVEAYSWLDSHGHSGIITTQVAVNFERGELAKAKELAESLSGKYDVQGRESVHPQTLKAWAAEMLANGEDFPTELFGIFRQQTTKIS